MQTMYERLQAHLTKHAYKRGENKGDAPLDADRRGRSHERVSTRLDHMAVRFWNTDVIRAYPDGRIVLNCGGWYMSPTTKTCVNDALRWFGGNIAWLYSDRLYGKTQTVLKVIGGNRYAYYDGIVLGANGAVLSEIKPFAGKRIDRSESKALYEDMKECGFTDVFTMLHSVAEKNSTASRHSMDPDNSVQYADAHRMRDIITMTNHADKWPDVIQRFSFEHGYNWNTRVYDWQKIPRQQAWDRLMAFVKRPMYDTVEIKEDTIASNT